MGSERYRILPGFCWIRQAIAVYQTILGGEAGADDETPPLRGITGGVGVQIPLKAGFIFTPRYSRGVRHGILSSQMAPPVADIGLARNWLHEIQGNGYREVEFGGYKLNRGVPRAISNICIFTKDV